MMMVRGNKETCKIIFSAAVMYNTRICGQA